MKKNNIVSSVKMAIFRRLAGTQQPMPTFTMSHFAYCNVRLYDVWQYARFLY